MRAIAAAVEPCDVRDRGARDLPFAWTPEPGDALLYPVETSIRAEPEAVRRLVVIDGTWRQTRRALYHLPGLVSLPRLDLPPRREDVRRLRRPPSDALMSTAEAVANALRVLGDEEPAAHVEAVFDLQYAAIARLRGWVNPP